MKETNCPYCGHKMSINTLNLSSQDIICEYCGMSIKDFVEEKLRTGQLGQEMGGYPQGQQYHQPVMPSKPVMPQPPISSPNPLPSIPANPVNLPKAQQVVPNAATKGEALLIMPQINQFLRIAPKTMLYHFGRNSVLSLIKPGHNVDLEWLNSISRIKRDKYNQVARDHFNITRTKIGQYYIEDTESSWGTWVNGKQIKGKGRTRIKNGAKIELMMSKPGLKTVYPFVIEFKC